MGWNVVGDVFTLLGHLEWLCTLFGEGWFDGGGDRLLVQFLIGLSQKVCSLSLVLVVVGVVGFPEEGVSGWHSLLKAHVDGANQLLYIQIGEFCQFVAGFDVVAEEDCISRCDIVLLAVFVALAEEGNEVFGGGYAQVEELYYLQVAQVLVLLDGLAQSLRDHTHLHVELREFEQGLEEILLQHSALLVSSDHDALRQHLIALGGDQLQKSASRYTYSSYASPEFLE